MSHEAIEPISSVRACNRIEAIDAYECSHPARQFFDSLLKLERVHDDMLLFQIGQLEKVQETFKELSADRLKKGEEALDKKHASENWSWLHSTWTTVVSAVSTVVGLGVMATPGGMLAGGAMVASGSLSIANLAATQAGLWDKAAQWYAPTDKASRERIAQMIPAAIDVSGSVIGLLGASSAILEQALALSESTIKIAKTAGYFGEAASTVAKSSFEKEARDIQADLLELTTKSDLNQTDLDNITERIQRFSEQMGQVQSQAAYLVQQITQKV